MSISTTLSRPEGAALPAAEAAAYLGLAAQTLANWRARGKGPAYSRLGGVGRPVIVYLKDDLDAFLRATRVETSTSTKAVEV